MEKVPVHVISIDSEDDDLEIVSENILNYGNCPTPVEVAPELQEKLQLSLEKLSSIPGNIKAIKVYAIKKKKNELGTIRASFSSANGKLGQVVNVGSVFDGIFNNQAKVVTNNNFGDKREHVQSPTTHSETNKTVKPQPEVKQDEIPLTLPSPVILYSPIQKGKQCTIRNESLQNVIPSNQTSHKNGSSPNWVSPTFLKDNENLVSSQFFQYSQQERNKDISEIEINVSENISRSPEHLSFDPLLLDKGDNGVERDNHENLFVNIRGKSNPVELYPIKFSSDEEEEFKLDNSILDSCSTPKSSLEEELSLDKVDEFYAIDDMLDDMELDDSSRDLVGEQETKDKTDKKYDDDNENQVEKEFTNESENMFQDIEPELTKENANFECKQFSKFPSVDIKRLSKGMLEYPERDESIPPQWINIFPPSPPTLPPPGWTSSENLWQLDAIEFMEVTGLCGIERAKEVRKQVNAPKPRVLRKRR